MSTCVDVVLVQAPNVPTRWKAVYAPARSAAQIVRALAMNGCVTRTLKKDEVNDKTENLPAPHGRIVTVDNGRPYIAIALPCQKQKSRRQATNWRSR